MATDDAGSARETDAVSGSAPAEPAPHQRRSRRWQPIARRPRHAQRHRLAWRAWRRSRPFWGGLLLVLAGLELLAIPLSGILVHGAIKLVIYIGIGGVFGVLIGVLLIASGIMLVVNPAQRVFYAIAGIVLGIASFPASNLGGFFLGMLLAIIGGSIGFSWTPIEAAPVSVAADGGASGEEPDAGIALVTGGYEEPADEAGLGGTPGEQPERDPATVPAAGEADPERAGEAEPDAEASAGPTAEH